MDLLNRTGIQMNTNHCLTEHVSALQTAPDLNLVVATVQDSYMIAGRPVDMGCIFRGM
ncbi:hypothetical protein AVEN_83413-1, partial [Araneus ventricosus]